jgi:hypothetical protein
MAASSKRVLVRLTRRLVMRLLVLGSILFVGGLLAGCQESRQRVEPFIGMPTDMDVGTSTSWRPTNPPADGAKPDAKQQ